MFSTKFKQLGLKIQYYRQMKNISQVELADEAGISRSYLSKIETGKSAVQRTSFAADCASPEC